MTASAQLDGRIDWNGTLAALNAAQPASHYAAGILASTTDYGEVVSNPTAGEWEPINATNVSGSDPTVTYNVPLTGFNLTIVAPPVAAATILLLLDPAGTLATGAVKMPASPFDNLEVEVATSQTITALTVTANSGQTILGAPTTLAANSAFKYRYRAANLKWYRVL